MMGVWKRQITWLFCTILVFHLTGFAGQSDPSGVGNQDDLLAVYISKNLMTPEDFVIKTFSDNDIVFIGEKHRVKHDVELIQRLIPRLYQAGVYNLAIEFGSHEDQELADRLVTGERYDSEIARKLIFRCLPMWGMKEYQDLYKVAWSFNRSLPAGVKTFRIVNLSYNPRWSLLKNGKSKAIWEKVLYRGSVDSFMAENLRQEVLDKGEKALVYCGIHHAFTRFQQPRLIEGSIKHIKERFGNTIYLYLKGKRTYTIFLHGPWETPSGKMILPVGGKIDRTMENLGIYPVGFDLRFSPFGQLKDDASQYSVGSSTLLLKNFCDGYIYQKPLNQYEGCTVDPQFVTSKNFPEFLAGTQASPTRSKTPQEFLKAMDADVDIQSRFSEALTK
jgi:hypothetical protein